MAITGFTITHFQIIKEALISVILLEVVTSFIFLECSASPV